MTNLVNLWRDLLRRCNADSGVKLHVPYVLARKNQHEYLSSDLYLSTDGKRKLLFLRNFGTEISYAELNWETGPYQIKEVIVDGKHVQWNNGETLPELEYFVLISAEK